MSREGLLSNVLCHYPRSCAEPHPLNSTGAAGVILMFQFPFEDVGDDFHLSVRVHRESRRGTNAIVVEDLSAPKPCGRVVVVVEAEVPVGRQPIALEVISSSF